MTVIHIGATMIGAEDTIRFDSDVGTLKALARQLLKERNEALEMLETIMNILNGDDALNEVIASDIGKLLAKARGES